MLYKFWVYYYLFIKKVYKKRWKDMNSSIFALAFACLFIICLFSSVVLEFTFNFKGLMHLLNKGLPLGVIAIFLGFIVLFPMILLLNKAVIKNKISIIRITLLKMKQINSLYTVAYLILCSILFLLTILIVILNSRT